MVHVFTRWLDSQSGCSNKDCFVVVMTVFEYVGVDEFVRLFNDYT